MRTLMPAPPTRWLSAVAVTIVVALAWPGSARAEFQITYVFTDPDGTPRPELRLVPTDMATYSNLASCQCGHRWGARVLLDDSTGASVPNDAEVRTYVGARCDLGQTGLVEEAYPCVEVHSGVASEYRDGGVLVSFEQVWLSSRVQDRAMQSIDTATPRLPCSPDQVGSGGIWICVESNAEPGCQADELVVKGDSNVNGELPGIQYDYMAPLSQVTGFVAEPDDHALVVSWERSEVPDVSGFRALCTDMDGNAPMTEVDEITEAPTGRSRTSGKLYYTAESLCPGQVVYPPDPDVDPPEEEDLADSPLATLDWRYVCTEHLASTGNALRVEGLEKDEGYDLVVVAYDAFGNPRLVSDLLMSSPTGACDCRTDGSAPTGAWLGTGLVLLGLVRRRRRRPGA